jgi:phosphoglycolate phosphatase
VIRVPPKGLLFDKDGTLFDFHLTWPPLLRALAEDLAKGREELVCSLLRAIGHDEAAGRFLPGSIGTAGDTYELADAWLPYLENFGREALVTALDTHFAIEGPARSVPVTDLAALFSELRERGHVIGIATNDVEASALETVERFGLSPLVDFVAGYDSGHGPKPGPGMALAFCSAVQLRPSDIAVIGDNAHDFDMGLRAGAGLYIGVLTGSSGQDDLAPLTDHVIDNVALLPALFDRLGEQERRASDVL